MAKQTRGTLQKAPCPHCKRPNTLDSFIDMQSGQMSDGLEATGLIESGTVFLCDHCGRRCRIVRVLPITMVWLSPE